MHKELGKLVIGWDFRTFSLWFTPNWW